MKIIVNFIAADSRGALSILKDFYEYIKKESEYKNIEWLFMLSDRYIEETSNIKIELFKDIKKSWINRLKFDLITGKKFIDNQNADLLINFQNTCVFGAEIPQILYIHQSIPFQSEKKFSLFKKNERKLFVYQYIIGRLIKLSIKKASHVVVQTNWMKKSIISQCRTSNSKISIIKPTISISEDIRNIQRKHESNLFFYPAAEYIYKNHDVIYKAVKELNKRNIKDFKVYLTIKNNGNNIDNIEFLGEISRKDVFEYYSKSTLVFPSYIETFGLPLEEAKLINSKIIAADCDYAREVIGSYKNVAFFNPFDYMQLANLMGKSINSDCSEIKFNDEIFIESNRSNWGKIDELLNIYLDTTRKHS